MESTPSPLRVYITDVKLTARTWRRSGGILIAFLIIWVVTLIPGLLVVERLVSVPLFIVFGLVLLCITVWTAGLSGAERIWYLRGFREQPYTVRELWRHSWKLLGRFLVLGILVGGCECMLSVPVFFIILVVVSSTTPTAGEIATLRSVQIIADVVFAVLADIFMTFMTPALALSTTAATDAFRYGLRLLRHTWPNAFWYVITPGLTVSVLYLVLPQFGVLTLVLGVVVSALYLFLKGPAVFYYVRMHPFIGESGSVGAVRGWISDGSMQRGGGQVQTPPTHALEYGPRRSGEYIAPPFPGPWNAPAVPPESPDTDTPPGERPKHD